MKAIPTSRRAAMLLAAGAATVFSAGTALRLLADCASFGLPFTDLASETSFCAAIAEAYDTGLTNGTSATTYAPSATVTRDQMAAFITRTLDQSLLRAGRRAALEQWWTQTPQYANASLGLTTVGDTPSLCKSDGADVWVASEGGVTRVRSSDGKSLQTWTFSTGSTGSISAVLVAMGKVFLPTIGGEAAAPGVLWMIDPTMNPGDSGAAIDVASLPNGTEGIAFDGQEIWVTSQLGSVSTVTPGSTTPWSVTTVKTGFTQPIGALFDGANIWITDSVGKLFKLGSDGGILQEVSVGAEPEYPTFDGHNIWVPNSNGNSLTVVRALDGTVLKTFSAGNGNQNGLNRPFSAAFDGQRILVANLNGGLSLFRATDLSAIGTWATPGVTGPYGVCSDGANFWVSFTSSNTLGRY